MSVEKAKQALLNYKYSALDDKDIDLLCDLMRAIVDERISGNIETDGRKVCEHVWIDIRNEVIKSGEMCSRCYTLRAGNQP